MLARASNHQRQNQRLGNYFSLQQYSPQARHFRGAYTWNCTYYSYATLRLAQRVALLRCAINTYS